MKVKSSYSFEVICKNALIKELKDKYNEDLSIEDLHIVWFSKVLKNYKCTIVDLQDNNRYYECTYNGEKDELYIDIYDKQYNVVYSSEDMDDIARPREYKVSPKLNELTKIRYTLRDKDGEEVMMTFPLECVEGSTPNFYSQLRSAVSDVEDFDLESSTIMDRQIITEENE